MACKYCLEKDGHIFKCPMTEDKGDRVIAVGLWEKANPQPPTPPPGETLAA